MAEIPKVLSPLFTTLNWGRGGDEVCLICEGASTFQFELDWPQGLCPRLQQTLKTLANSGHVTPVSDFALSILFLIGIMSICREGYKIK